MGQIFKWLWRILSTLIVLSLFVSLVGYFWLKRTVQPANGEMAVTELSAPVEILRDSFGIPHIYGATAADNAFALGFAHAQDRLWQMELARRTGQGRLSEMFGARTIRVDRYLRTLDLYGHASRSVSFLKPETRNLLIAYAAGVNAFLTRETGFFEPKYPPQFILLRHEPEPWTPADSLVIMKTMAIGLSTNIYNELERLSLASSFSSPEMRDLLPPYPGSDEPPLPDLSKLYPLKGVPDVASLRDILPSKGASNNWVVDGTRTVSGKPLLANDPHLGLTAPSVWYLAHLAQKSGNKTSNVMGTTLPGVPLIVLGRNDYVSWGFTNSGADVQDLFVEKIDPTNSKNYLTPTGSRPFDVRRVVIKVKDQDDIPHTILETRHGPVLPVDGPFDIPVAEGYVLALRWTALADNDRTIEAGIDAMNAQNADDFIAAMRNFRVPMQNMVYADVKGNIGLTVPGAMPIRHPANQVAGRAPVPGWDARFDWRGFVPPDRMPAIANPDSGAIATANQKITGSGYPFLITHDWERPYRAERITELINDRPIHSVESFQALQMDDYSPLAARLLPLMIAAVHADPKAPDSGHIDRILEQLSKWDHQMRIHTAEPLIFMAWMRSAMSAVFADELKSDFRSFQNHQADTLVGLLEGRAQNKDWCDDTSTEKPEKCGQVLGEALARALAELNREYGNDMALWQWGDAHMAVSPAKVLGKIPLIGSLFDIEVPSAGGPYTLNRGDVNFNSDRPYANVHASSYRAIYDMGDLDRSLWIHTTGQSGNPFSPHYDDMAEMWARGEYLTMTTKREEIEAGADGSFMLIPKPPDPVSADKPSP